MLRFCNDNLHFKTPEQISTRHLAAQHMELNSVDDWVIQKGRKIISLHCINFIFDGSALNLLHVVLFTGTSLSSDERVRALRQKGSFIGLLPCLCSSPPPSTLWSTVLPHTNTPYGGIGVSRTANICFPRWFCYCNSLSQKQGQGFRAASFLLQPKCLHLLICSYIHTQSEVEYSNSTGLAQKPLGPS